MHFTVFPYNFFLCSIFSSIENLEKKNWWYNAPRISLSLPETWSVCKDGSNFLGTTRNTDKKKEHKSL